MPRPSLDLFLLFGTRMARMFAYGAVSVILVLYLVQRGLGEASIGLLLTLTLLGDTAISLWLTTHADRFGRRRTLFTGAGLMIAAGAVFAATGNVPLLLAAATIGVISPSGYEVGPFLAIEQAGLTQLVSPTKRTSIFAWYNLCGSFATALGAAVAGVLTQSRIEAGGTALDGYRAVLMLYAAMGLVLALAFGLLSPMVEPPHNSSGSRTWWGLGRSRRSVLRLSGLFSLDAFGGGFVVQSVVAYWFHLRFHVPPAGLGAIFFATNLLAGISALLAARLARRIGLIRTMVFTHIPSNLLLLLVPLMPSLPLAVALLLLRYTISQMDVPARQSYTMGLVDPEERSAAAGVTGVARTTGAALSPGLAAAMVASSAWMNLPFFLAGSIKLAYDLLLYRGFRNQRVQEEPGLRLE